MVEGVVVNVDQQITKQRRNQLYLISDKKKDVSIKRSGLHIRSSVIGPVIVLVLVNLQDTALILIAEKKRLYLPIL